MDGFFIINKPKGITSFGVCNKIKHTLNEKHVGHTGTLDPDTTGVLVVGVGKGCKMMSLLNEHDKSYKTTIMLGKSSDTLDISGNILADVKTNISEKEITDAVLKLSKMEKQVPPMYSAIKINGKKMYDLAREGKMIDLPPRDIKIYKCEIDKIYEIDGYQMVDITLDVSKGFYVRSFARDLGDILGVPSLMYSLHRSKAGDYCDKDAIELENISGDTIISIEDMFDFPKLELNEFVCHLAKNGAQLGKRHGLVLDKPYKLYYSGKLIAIYQRVGDDSYKPLLIMGE